MFSASFAQDSSTAIFGPCLIEDGKQEKDDDSSSRGPCVMDSASDKVSGLGVEQGMDTHNLRLDLFRGCRGRLRVDGEQKGGCTHSRPYSQRRTQGCLQEL